jgi:hypothetical protein
MSAFENILKNCLADYQAPAQRYRNLGFSSKDFAVLNQITQTLKTLLPDYTVWDVNQPNLNNTPPQTCSRKDFIEQAFDLSRTGLIISEPDFWLSRWHILDKQAFWSALSTRFGGHNVIVVFPENHAFAQINQHYFYSKTLDSTPITAWISTKTLLT